MEKMKQEERTEDFSRVYQEMDNEDKEKVVLTAKNLLIAQKTIKEGREPNNEDFSSETSKP